MPRPNVSLNCDDDVVSSSNPLHVSLGSTPSALPYGADYTDFTYVGSGAADDDLIATQVFKTGGSGGVTVATLTFAYVGATNNIASITKT